MNSYTYDVYISCCDNDYGWVEEELVPKLASAGLRVIDHTKHVAGTPRVQNVENAVTNSRHTLIILTPDRLANEWSHLDEILARTLDPSAKKRRLIPILLKTCENIPSWISDLSYVDFRNRDKFEDSLQWLVKNLLVRQENTESVQVPTVVIAMTQVQAFALVEETAFRNSDSAPVEQTIFRQVKNSFQESFGIDWQEHYSDAPENWRPYVSPGSPIQKIILNIANTSTPIIQPVFESMNFLSDDLHKRMDTWNKLNETGCLIIIDAISLLHPLIYRKLLQAEISANKKVAIAMLMLAEPALKTNKLIEQEIKNRLQRAFDRFDRREDPFCQLDMTNERHLRRWLRDKLPQIATQIQYVPEQANITLIQQRTGKTHGMAEAIRKPWGD